MMTREETIALIRAQLKDKAVSERKMMGSLIFMVGDHMCCGVGDGRILLRLGEKGAMAACAEPHVTPMMMGEKPAKGYVHVASAGYPDAAALAKWVGMAEAFVKTLPPKKK
jgi:TfoX/Sxy family transcriptional regulator of competence genes